MTTMEEFFGEAIHSYSRAQAIADGVLIPVEAGIAAEAGFRIPVALTAAAWADCVTWTRDDGLQDETGRLWDVLWMTSHAVRRVGGTDRARVRLLRVRNDGTSFDAEPVTLVATIGPGDQGEPVLTMMLPGES